MARGPRKPRFGGRQRNQKPKHNWSNDATDKKRMLDMRRGKYFRLDLRDILADTKNQDNKELIAATITQKASQKGIDDALEYIDRISGDTLEKEISEDVRKLLKRNTRFR